MSYDLTWHQARDVLTESGRYGVNEAQYLLEELVHWSDSHPDYAWSFRDAERRLRWMQYAGLDGDRQPVYRVTESRPGFEKENAAGREEQA